MPNSILFLMYVRNSSVTLYIIAHIENLYLNFFLSNRENITPRTFQVLPPFFKWGSGKLTNLHKKCRLRVPPFLKGGAQSAGG
jgi:hypothetical protein